MIYLLGAALAFLVYAKARASRRWYVVALVTGKWELSLRTRPTSEFYRVASIEPGTRLRRLGYPNAWMALEPPRMFQRSYVDFDEPRASPSCIPGLDPGCAGREIKQAPEWGVRAQEELYEADGRPVVNIAIMPMFEVLEIEV